VGSHFFPLRVVRLLVRTVLVRLSGCLSVACARFFLSVSCVAVCYEAVRLVRLHVSRSLRLPGSSSPPCPSLWAGVHLSNFECSIHESAYGMDQSHPDGGRIRTVRALVDRAYAFIAVARKMSEAIVVEGQRIPFIP